MAIRDATVVLKGDQAVVRMVQIVQELDKAGKVLGYRMSVGGETQTAEGKQVGLEPAQEAAPIGTAVLDRVWERALPVLRKANGLE